MFEELFTVLTLWIPTPALWGLPRCTLQGSMSLRLWQPVAYEVHTPTRPKVAAVPPGSRSFVLPIYRWGSWGAWIVNSLLKAPVRVGGEQGRNPVSQVQSHALSPYATRRKGKGSKPLLKLEGNTVFLPDFWHVVQLVKLLKVFLIKNYFFVCEYSKLSRVL